MRDPLDELAEETWWSLMHMSYTGSDTGWRPDLRKEDVEDIAYLICDLAKALREAERELAEAE